MRRSLLILGWALMAFGARGEGPGRPPILPAVPPPGPVPTAGGAPVAATPATAPRIQFAEMAHDFGRVSSGSVERHDFVFTNTGNAVLEITAVRPGCGCTTAGEWDRRVAPGGTGKIPLQFNSTGFGGQVIKSATVTCNDPAQPSSLLQLRATVWRPIEVTPASAYFNISSESATNETRVVRIVNNLETPLTLSEPEYTNASFRVELATVRPGKEFELRVTAQPPFASAYVQTPITVKTSSTNTPAITVRAYANIQPAIQVIPSQIVLPSGPAVGTSPPTITIRNNGTNVLSVSEAAINVEGATVNLREVQPGRVFSAALSLPPGLRIPPGERVELTLKSNHPKHPVIRVPVFQPQTQPPRPAAAPAASRPGTEGIPPLLARPAAPVTTVPNPPYHRPPPRGVPPLP